MVYHYTKRAMLARLLANEGPAIYVVHLNRYFVIPPWYYLVVTFLWQACSGLKIVLCSSTKVAISSTLYYLACKRGLGILWAHCYCGKDIGGKSARCHDLAKQLSYYLFFFSFLDLLHKNRARKKYHMTKCHRVTGLQVTVKWHHMTKSHRNCGKVVYRPCSSCISSVGNLMETLSSPPCQLG